MAVFVSGTGTNMAALLYASRLPNTPFEIVLVASNVAAAPALALAEAEGVRSCAIPHRGMERAEHDAAMDRAAGEAEADTIALAGYMRLLGPRFVDRWRGRLVNIHPSLLPLYPGLDTHARALAAGDTHAGATVHLVSDEMDAGEVLGQARVAVLPGDTPRTLADRVRIAEHQLYPRVLTEYVRRHREMAGRTADASRPTARSGSAD